MLGSNSPHSHSLSLSIILSIYLSMHLLKTYKIIHCLHILTHSYIYIKKTYFQILLFPAACPAIKTIAISVASHAGGTLLHGSVWHYRRRRRINTTAAATPASPTTHQTRPLPDLPDPTVHPRLQGRARNSRGGRETEVPAAVQTTTGGGGVRRPYNQSSHK